MGESILFGLPVVALETLNSEYPAEEFEVFVAIPSTQLNRLRTRLYLSLKDKGYKFATYISSRAFVWRNAKVGENCFIFKIMLCSLLLKLGITVFYGAVTILAIGRLLKITVFYLPMLLYRVTVRLGTLVF
eukprot:TRINITY_DN3218_c0_g1_i1.p1 TRINITY_DN3218_c0_g1~~TRINITY_DN3218_c0_g1_i1.p1  ORF type:complete len:150 (-),score=39.65 TRINITY_DN3218_c0_g1_i1:187-579(-)